MRKFRSIVLGVVAAAITVGAASTASAATGPANATAKGASVSSVTWSAPTGVWFGGLRAHPMGA